MSKKWFAAMALCMGLILCSCGGSDGRSDAGASAADPGTAGAGQTTNEAPSGINRSPDRAYEDGPDPFLTVSEPPDVTYDELFGTPQVDYITAPEDAFSGQWTIAEGSYDPSRYFVSMRMDKDCYLCVSDGAGLYEGAWEMDSSSGRFWLRSYPQWNQYDQIDRRCYELEHYGDRMTLYYLTRTGERADEGAVYVRSEIDFGPFTAPEEVDESTLSIAQASLYLHGTWVSTDIYRNTSRFPETFTITPTHGDTPELIGVYVDGRRGYYAAEGGIINFMSYGREYHFEISGNQLILSTQYFTGDFDNVPTDSTTYEKVSYTSERP